MSRPNWGCLVVLAACVAFWGVIGFVVWTLR